MHLYMYLYHSLCERRIRRQKYINLDGPLLDRIYYKQKVQYDVHELPPANSCGINLEWCFMIHFMNALKKDV